MPRSLSASVDARVRVYMWVPTVLCVGGREGEGARGRERKRKPFYPSRMGRVALHIPPNGR